MMRSLATLEHSEIARKVDGSRLDRTPVTDRQFREYVKATGHKTFAEIPPDPNDYPGALPHAPVRAELLRRYRPSARRRSRSIPRRVTWASDAYSENHDDDARE